MATISNTRAVSAGVLLLGLVSAASGHAHGGESASLDIASATVSSNSSSPVDIGTPSYFRHPEHSGLMLGHIISMSIAWIFVLPLGVMFSIVRSRYNFPTQLSFSALNAVGVTLALIYNARTPDLYPNNFHHKFAWIITWIVCAQTFMALIRIYADKKYDADNSTQSVPFIPVSTEAIAVHQRGHNLEHGEGYRYSNDSGQGTERNTESLRSHSLSSAEEDAEDLQRPLRSIYEPAHYEEKPRSIAGTRLDNFLSKMVSSMDSSRVFRILLIAYDAINRLILILGFVAITTGIVTYAGIFRGHGIFSGLAHFIKGAIFMWYGILTLGRWAGCFANLGWAWNIKAKANSKPSAEFVESFLIFLYGSTNVFLEHLGGWGKGWSPTDLEHFSITIMFFGGGLCGMLIESRRIRDLLNITILQSAEQDPYIINGGNSTAWQAPKSYGFSMNPLPALIVLLLGSMMSSHTQNSMVSSMVHRQWGNLLAGAALARAVTYLLFYISPPTSFLPSRPPSELITAFCLMAGGLIFMASSSDTIAAMEYNDIDAMFVFTVAMGLITFMMAWIIVVIGIKGWALRRELKSPLWSPLTAEA